MQSPDYFPFYGWWPGSRFLEGHECGDGSERASRRRNVIAQRGSPTRRAVIRIKCRRERDFRFFVKRSPPRCRRWWTDDAGFLRRSSWAAVFHWQTHSSSLTIIPTSSSRRWVSSFLWFSLQQWLLWHNEVLDEVRCNEWDLECQLKRLA